MPTAADTTARMTSEGVPPADRLYPSGGREAGVPAEEAPAEEAPADGTVAAVPRRYAAVDLGSHNCRMLIAEAEVEQAGPAADGEGRGGGPDRGSLGERLRVLGAMSRAARLGEGVAVSGRLGEAAMQRTLEALRLFAARLQRERVARVQGVATEACRKAANGVEFLDRARAETGIELRPISAREESRLTLAGCRSLIDANARRTLLFDIGGGSTEVAWVAPSGPAAPRVLDIVSLPLGVVSFAERFGGDVVDPSQFAEMTGEIDAGLDRFDAEHAIGACIRDGGVQMIGTSGTVTTLAAVVLGLRHYRRWRVDGEHIAREALRAAARRLAASDWQTRANAPCIGPDRADLVIAGCAILEAILRRWPVPAVRVADRGIREGLLQSMLAEDCAHAVAPHGPAGDRR